EGVPPPHPRVFRERLLVRLEEALGFVGASRRELVEREVDLGVGHDLGIAELARDLGRALVDLARSLVAPDLAEAPAERVQKAALPRAVRDAIADLVALLELRDRAAVVAEAAARLPEEPVRPYDEVREAKLAADLHHLLGERDRARVVAGPLGEERLVEAHVRFDDAEAAARRLECGRVVSLR